MPALNVSSLARPLLVGAAALAIALAGVVAHATGARAQTPTPQPVPPIGVPPRGSFAGVPPAGAGIAMLVTTETTTAQALTSTLTDTGCQVETIAILRPPSRVPGDPVPLAGSGEWTPFVAGAPAAANEGFVRVLPSIPANTPFFLRCRTALTPQIDPANARYRIGADIVTLVNGISDVPLPVSSASRITTLLTDRRAFSDIDGGGADAAVILTQNTGGSGTFSYLAFQAGAQPASLGPTVLLGDRVTVTGLWIASGRIMVTYLDHRPTEPFAVAPTLPMTKLFAVSGGTLVEVGSLVG
ncbi:MAG: hypothetical protein U0360_10860 [Dehalococcoidia bacterium]